MDQFLLLNRPESTLNDRERETIIQIGDWVANSCKQIIGELPPIYPYHGFPGAEYEGQNPNNAANKAGFDFGMSLYRQLFMMNSIHWFHMIDDVHGKDPDGETQFINIQNEYRDIERGNSDMVFQESTFRKQYGSTCAQMDALFQMEKIRAVLEKHGLDGAIQNCRFLVIHPDSFVHQTDSNPGSRPQQEVMLSNLLGAMKNEPLLQNVSKGRRRELIEKLYRWITYDDSGNLSGFAQARWNSKLNRFEINRCENLDLTSEGEGVLPKAVY